MGLFTPQMRNFGAKKKKSPEAPTDEEVEAEAVEDVVEEVVA